MAKAPIEIRSKARSHADAAIRVLIEIMNDRSVAASVRAYAATEILNRGLGKLEDATKFIVANRRYYVYSVHNTEGRLIYIGKGIDRRHLQSARRLVGKSRVRAEFTSEKAALLFEARLIKRFKPQFNLVHNKVA